MSEGTNTGHLYERIRLLRAHSGQSIWAPSRLTAAKRPGHRQPLAWAGDLGDPGATIVPGEYLASIKRLEIFVGWPPQGLTLAFSAKAHKVRISPVREGRSKCSRHRKPLIQPTRKTFPAEELVETFLRKIFVRVFQQKILVLDRCEHRIEPIGHRGNPLKWPISNQWPQTAKFAVLTQQSQLLNSTSSLPTHHKHGKKRCYRTVLELC